MRLVDFIPTVKGQVLTKIEGLENVEIFNAYVSDLLSDVMGFVGKIWHGLLLCAILMLWQ